MVICLSWYLYFWTWFLTYRVLTFNRLIFGDKTVRVLGFHIWNQLLETLIANSSFQTLERSLNDWFKPKWMFLLEVNKNYIKIFLWQYFPSDFVRSSEINGKKSIKHALKRGAFDSKTKNNLLARKIKYHDDPEDKLQTVKKIYKIRKNQ